MRLADISPQVRYVNDYSPSYDYVEQERVIYDHEFMYIMAGTVTMHFGDGVYRLQKGDLFHLSPGIRNHIEVDGSVGLRMHCIHFDFAPLGEMYDFTAEEYYIHAVLSATYLEKLRLLQARPDPVPEDFPLPRLTRGIPCDVLSPLFERCYRAFITPTVSGKLQAKAALLDIIALLARDAGAAAHEVHPLIAQTLAYIKQNSQLPLTVAGLAGRCGLSPKYFGKLFHDATGQTLRAFLLDLRLFAAREMLLGSDLSIEQIAAQVGFGDAFYFSKCFRRQEQVSPAQYRRLMKAR